MSLSDGAPMMTMPVAPANNYGGGMGMWGENWIWIIVLFLFGWGRNGWGNNAGNSGGVVDGYVLTSDFANVERKIDSVNDGLCNGFYQQAQLANGTNMAMANGFAQAELSRSNQQAALMQQLNAMQMQAANCCCENRQGQAQIQYDMATNTCAITTAIANQTQQIMQNDNANYRALHDEMVANRMADKDETIAQLRTQLSQMSLAASQQAQNNYLVSQLRPAPNPAYIVQNPNAAVGCNGLTGCCNMAS